MQNTPNMMAQLPRGVVCPAGFGYGNATDTQSSRTNGRCVLVSLPQISNDLFWQNRAFHVEIVDANGNPINGTTTPNGTGLQSHQNIVALLPQFTQSYTGQCSAPPAGQELYWDLGVRMDLLPNQNGHALNFDAATVGAGSYATGPGGGSGVTANSSDAGAIGLPASYSIFSDSLNTANVNPVGSVGNVVVAQGKTPVIGQYCNGARIPPEQCAAGQGANDPGMCKGYFTPAGQSETFGVAPVFVFNGIAASATVDEGNNWINMTYGPLTLGRPPATGSGSTPSAEPTVASAAVGIAQGAYSIMAGSDAVGTGNAAAPGRPALDFYGQTRSTTRTSIGAVELIPAAPTLTAIAPTSGMQGATVTVTLTGTNFTAGSVIGITGNGITQSGTSISATLITTTLAIGNNATLGARNVTVTTSGGTTAALTFTVVKPTPTLTASVSPNPLAFGNWAIGTTSTVQSLTVTNTGNTALAGGSFTFGGGTPQPFSRVTNGAFPNNAPNCAATLAVGASCTIKVTFTPATAVAFSRSLTVAYTGGATVTNAAVTLTGTGAARATVSVTPNPLTITLPTGAANITGTGTVTLTNTAAVGGAQVSITNVAVSGGSGLTYFFNVVVGQDNCINQTLAPGATCTVGVRFTNVLSARGTNRTGTITFTDNATGSPQSGQLIGFATK
jgi:hypothetical protein